MKIYSIIELTVWGETEIGVFSTLGKAIEKLANLSPEKLQFDEQGSRIRFDIFAKEDGVLWGIHCDDEIANVLWEHDENGQWVVDITLSKNAINTIKEENATGLSEDRRKRLKASIIQYKSDMKELALYRSFLTPY